MGFSCRNILTVCTMALPLTDAERMKRHRAKVKNDPDRREHERARWQRRVASGKVVGIKQLPPKEQLARRKVWRKSQAKTRGDRRVVHAATSETPPLTPEAVPDQPPNIANNAAPAPNVSRLVIYSTVVKENECFSFGW